MEEIQEVLEDFGQNAKSLFKSKPFKIAALGVGAVALYVALTKNNEEDDATAYGAIGYAGYPTVNSGGESVDSGTEGSDSAYFETLLAMMQADQQSQIADLQSSIEGLYETGDSYSSLESNSVELRNAQDESAAALYELQRQNAISQMRANSELYNNISDRATKDALHAENMAIAEEWGWEYNADTGNYFEGNSVLYTTSQQQANVLEGKKTNASGGSNGAFVSNVDYQAEINKAITEGASATVIDNLNAQREAKIAASGTTTAKANSSYDKNVDYQALINKAKSSGASQSVIDNLTAQRNAKIKGENLNSDGSKKT